MSLLTSPTQAYVGISSSVDMSINIKQLAFSWLHVLFYFSKTHSVILNGLKYQFKVLLKRTKNNCKIQ